MYYTNPTHRFYLLCLILTSAVFSGCNVIPGPTPVPTPVELKTPPSNADEDETILAISIADTLGVPDNAPTPGPSPTIKVGDKCPVCEGRGKSGDGIQPCGPCRGDGRVDAGDPVLSTETPTEHSIVVETVGRYEFKDLQELVGKLAEQVESSYTSMGQKIAQEQVEDDGLKDAVEKSTARINELEAKVSALVASVDKLTKPSPLPSQEKSQAKPASVPTGYWKTTQVKVKKCNGRRCWYEYENRQTWVPYTTSNPQSSSDPYYPTRGGLWSGCGSWKHLTQGEHQGKFDPTWLQGLSWHELQSLHSDDHDGRVKWQYVVRGS